MIMTIEIAVASYLCMCLMGVILGSFIGQGSWIYAGITAFATICLIAILLNHNKMVSIYNGMKK